MRHFEYVEGRLFAEEVDLERLADTVKTPTFVYARATIERHFQVFDDSLAGHPHLICYSVKANSNAAVLNLLARRGCGADIVSGGELVRAMKAGISPDRIVFSGVGKTQDEMAAALDAGILAFNVESEPELAALAEVAQQKGVVAPVALRVNPDVDAQTHPYIATGLKSSKFGIPIDEAVRIASGLIGHRSVRLVGVDCHIGSQLTSLDPVLEALDSVLALVDELKAAGHAIEMIDIGGGLGIPYQDETPPLPSELGTAVVARLAGRPERIVLEPGRVIVGNAGIMLTRVLYVKRAPSKTFIVVDAGMNDLLRPCLYQAHHDIWPVKPRPGPKLAVDVVGPICESADVLARDRLLEPVESGDLLAVMSAGAYGFSMASTYNSRPLCAEVVVDGARHYVTRLRADLDSLCLGESIPNWEEQSQ